MHPSVLSRAEKLQNAGGLNMQHLIESVRTSLKQENWYAALAAALMIPDVCANLELEEDATSSDYINWCEKYVYPIYHGEPYNINIHGDEIYVLRCAYLHQGSANVSKQRKANILQEYRFILPLKNWSFHPRQVGGTRTFQLQVDTFCSIICEAAAAWARSVLDEREDVKDRSDELLKIYDARKGEFWITGPSRNHSRKESGRGDMRENKAKKQDDKTIRQQTRIDLTKR
jgi:hypothetical protein